MLVVAAWALFGFRINCWSLNEELLETNEGCEVELTIFRLVGRMHCSFCCSSSSLLDELDKASSLPRLLVARLSWILLSWPVLLMRTGVEITVEFVFS